MDWKIDFVVGLGGGMVAASLLIRSPFGTPIWAVAAIGAVLYLAAVVVTWKRRSNA